MIPLLGFAPDLDPTTPGAITACTNLIPTLKGMKGGYSGADVGMDALATAALAAAVLVKLDASSRLIVGTATKLWEKNGTTWTDRSATTYSASSSFPWHFAQFGDTTLAANKGDILQASSSGAFANAHASAPKAGALCTNKGFVMAGNTNEATYGDSPDRWWCSEYNNHAGWTPAVATQCATGRLVDSPGDIRGLKPLGDDIIAYKERSMYLGRYVGAPTVWNWTLLPGEAGCSSQDAVVNIGTAHAFIGYNDIYLFDGTRPTPIGAPVREWFFADLDNTYRYLIRGLHHRSKATVYWFYPRSGSGGVINGCLAYNYKSNTWGLAHRTVEAVVEFITGGYTWDSLPLTTWDSWPSVPYDSPFWSATSETPAYIGTDHKVYSLTGASASSSLTTWHVGEESIYTMVDRVTCRYLDSPTSATLTNSYTDDLGGAWTTDQTVTQSNGRFDFFRSARWHRAQIDYTGDVEVTAINASAKEDGE